MIKEDIDLTSFEDSRLEHSNVTMGLTDNYIMPTFLTAPVAPGFANDTATHAVTLHRRSGARGT